MAGAAVNDADPVVILSDRAVRNLPNACRSLARPDTLYLWAHATWKSSIAARLNGALMAIGAKRSMTAKIEAYLSEMDPFEAERLRQLPWHEMIAEIRSAEDNPLMRDDELPQVPVELAGRHFALVGYSPRRGCSFQLLGAGIALHGRVGSPNTRNPTLYLEIGSAPFWENADWKKYLIDWQLWLQEVSQVKVDWNISRLDFAFHTQLLNKSHIDRELYVCRGETRRQYTKAYILAELEKAHAADVYARSTGMPDTNIPKLIEKLHQETGMVTVDWFHGTDPQMVGFGRRGRIYARIYNKSREILRNPQKTALFHQVWSDAGFTLSQDVINVEFELSRSWLMERELVVNGQRLELLTLRQLLDHVEHLQAYLLGNAEREGWLRMIDKSRTRVENCPVAQAWQLLREASDVLPAVAAAERQHAAARVTAGSVIPAAVRLKARLDAYLGIDFDPDTVSVAGILDAMADMLALELDREGTAWSSSALIASYIAERARVDAGPLQYLHSTGALPHNAA